MRWRLGLLSLCLWQAPVVGFAQTPEGAPSSTLSASAASSLEQAKKLLDKGREADLLRAREILEAVAAEADSEGPVWYLLGVVHSRLGALADAADSFARATRIQPDLAQAWLGLGETERRLGDPETALRRFRRGLEVQPDNASLLEAEVRGLRLSGRLDEAIDKAKAALKEHALRLGLYHEMGHAWLAKDRIALASFVFEKAETVPGGSESPIVHTDIGWTRHLAEERYGARKSLDRALALDPDYLPAVIARARLAYDDRDYDTMLGLLERAANLDEDNPSIWLDLGVAYQGVGKADDALRSFEKARSLDRKDPAPLFNLGILYADELKDYDLATERFRAYVDAGGEKAEEASQHLEDIEREQARMKRRQEREERRKQREAERERQRKLLEEESSDGQPASDNPSPWQGE